MRIDIDECTVADGAYTNEAQEGMHALHAGLQAGGNRTHLRQQGPAKISDLASLHLQTGGSPGSSRDHFQWESREGEMMISGDDFQLGGHFQWEGDSKIVRRPRTMLVFINPASGKRRGMHVWEGVEGLFRAANIMVRVVVTRCKGHAFEVVRDNRDDYDGIVAVGGDGTFNEVLSGVLERRKREGGQDGEACTSGSTYRQQQTKLGIISAGSDCALAKFVSHLNPSLAAQAIINNQVRPLDVLRVGFRRTPGEEEQVRHSVCAVAWGIPGQVARESESLREKWGTYRYALSVVKNIIRLKPVKGSIRVSRAISSNSDDGTADQQGQASQADELLEGEFLVAGVFKCAGSIMPFSHPSDGCTDVVAITARSRVSLASLVMRAMCMHCVRPGSHLQLKELHFCKAREVIITPASPQDTLNIDGEVGEATRTHISILPSAITIFSRVP